MLRARRSTAEWRCCVFGRIKTADGGPRTSNSRRAFAALEFRPMSDATPAQLAPYVTSGAFLLAFVFGAVGNRTNFCTMGAVSDWVNMGDTSRLRMWLLAIAVALLGSSALQLAGVVDLTKSIYTGSNFTWLSYIVGGLLFGAGMTLGSGCGSKTLIRVGAGNLKSLVVLLIMAVAAYMTLRGLFGPFRARAVGAGGGAAAP